MPTIDPSTSRTDPNSLKNPPATKDFMSCASEENLFNFDSLIKILTFYIEFTFF